MKNEYVSPCCEVVTFKLGHSIAVVSVTHDGFQRDSSGEETYTF